MAVESEVEEFDLVGLQKKWTKILEDREPKYREYWDRARAVVRRYEDNRGTAGDGLNYTPYTGRTQTSRKYNILWSNTETMMPLLFNKVPDPVVRRKWGDDRPVARAAAEMLERASTANLQRKDVYFTDNMKATVQNMLVPGTGQLWAVYDAELQMGDIGQAQVGDEVVYFDYVHWSDFRCGKANSWSQVPWVSRDIWMSPDKFAKRWGPQAAVMCKPQRRVTEDNRQSRMDEYCITEIWDRDSGLVLFYCKDAPRMIEVVSDPLGLQCFYPCPKPLFGFWTTSDVIPAPIFCQYQDQAAELDTVTTQISNLLRACKVSGVYNDKMGADFQRMLEGSENKVVPVTDWADFTVTGGMGGNVVFMPLVEIVSTLTALYQAREGIKQDLNEITGMPDIFRGQSSPLDAEGTNDLKVQWGASRMRDDQREVQRFCADIIAISTEIMAEHFSPQTLVGMSGMNLPTEAELMMGRNTAAQMQAMGQEVPQELADRLEQPSIESVMTLIRSEKLRGFSLDVESDSTVEADDAKERTARAEFLDVLTGMVERWGPIVQQVPEMLPMVKELIMFAIAPFRAGRQLEEEVERTFTLLERKAKAAANQPPQPDAMDKATQAEMQKTAMQEQGDTQRTLIKEQGDTQRKVMDIAAEQDQARVKAIAEVAREVVAGQ